MSRNKVDKWTRGQLTTFLRNEISSSGLVSRVRQEPYGSFVHLSSSSPSILTGSFLVSGAMGLAGNLSASMNISASAFYANGVVIGASSGDATMASAITTDNVIVTTNGTSGKAIQQANANILTNNQDLKLGTGDLYVDLIRRASSNSTTTKVKLEASAQEFYVGHSSNEIMRLSSNGLRIADDKRLTFGDSDESYIEYDEAGADYLVISGSAKGMVLSGSTISASCGEFAIYNPHDGASAILRMIADKGDNATDHATLTMADSDVLTIAAKNITVDSEGSIDLDADGGAINFKDGSTLRGSFDVGTSAIVKVKDSAGTELMHYTTNVVEVQDDIKLQFGSAGESYIEYDEAGDDYLVISGSGNGMVLSGSSVKIHGYAHITGSDATQGDGTYLLQLQQSVDSGEFLKCVSNDGRASIALNHSGGGNGYIHLYDDGGNTRLQLDGDADPYLRFKDASDNVKGIIQYGESSGVMTVSGAVGLQIGGPMTSMTMGYELLVGDGSGTEVANPLTPVAIVYTNGGSSATTLAAGPSYPVFKHFFLGIGGNNCVITPSPSLNGGGASNITLDNTADRITLIWLPGKATAGTGTWSVWSGDGYALA